MSIKKIPWEIPWWSPLSPKQDLILFLRHLAQWVINNQYATIEQVNYLLQPGIKWILYDWLYDWFIDENTIDSLLQFRAVSMQNTANDWSYEEYGWSTWPRPTKPILLIPYDVPLTAYNLTFSIMPKLQLDPNDTSLGKDILRRKESQLRKVIARFIEIELRKGKTTDEIRAYLTMENMENIVWWIKDHSLHTA